MPKLSSVILLFARKYLKLHEKTQNGHKILRLTILAHIKHKIDKEYPNFWSAQYLENSIAEVLSGLENSNFWIFWRDLWVPNSTNLISKFQSLIIEIPLDGPNHHGKWSNPSETIAELIQMHVSFIENTLNSSFFIYYCFLPIGDISFHLTIVFIWSTHSFYYKKWLCCYQHLYCHKRFHQFYSRKQQTYNLFYSSCHSSSNYSKFFQFNSHN